MKHGFVISKENDKNIPIENHKHIFHDIKKKRKIMLGTLV